MTIENGSRAEECIQPTIGSSETTRESPLSSFSIAPSIARKANYSFDFDDFLLHHLPTHKKGVDIGFLEWLVGFVEGDGTFCYRLASGTTPTSSRMRFLFQICQKDPKVLYKIRTGLGFGTVRDSGDELTRHWRYTVEDRRGIQRIMALFNGNLVLPKRRRQFTDWVNQAAPIHHPSLVLKSSSGPMVSLCTGWLSGFIDAEGCFYANFTTPSRRFGVGAPPTTLSARLTQKMHITQKDVCGDKRVLAEIALLLQSDAKVSLAKWPHCHRIEISSLQSHNLLIDYLKSFPLRQKAVVCKQWWRVYLLRKEGRDLNETGIRRMRRLCTAMQKKETKTLLWNKLKRELEEPRQAEDAKNEERG